MPADYLKLVASTTDRLLTIAADPYGSPLFVDGFDTLTHQPVVWPWQGRETVPSNWACQQNWARTLVGLSALTGNPDYAQAATDACAYTMANLRHPSGLLYWGGHVAWDLRHQSGFGHAAPDRYHHELKTSYPYFELMHQVNPQATAEAIEAMWRAHIIDWKSLDFNRHGAYAEQTQPHPTWQMPYQPAPVFFVGQGLSFTNSGSDLFYAAAMLHQLNGDPLPKLWAERLAARYIETRNPQTGLSGYQFSQLERDRCQLQMGPEFGEKALEGKILDSGRATVRYAKVGIIQLQLGETLGDSGHQFLTWAHDDLTAFARHLYDPATNRFQPMWTDGIPLKPSDIKRPGYYNPTSFQPWQPQPVFLRAYALASRLTGDPAMWTMARAIAKGLNLGDIGNSPTATPTLNLQANGTDADLLLAVLELWRHEQTPALLDIALRLGDNLATAHHHHGVWAPTANHQYTRLDAREALALLHLAAAQLGKPDLVPEDRQSRAVFTCEYDNHPDLDRWHRIGDEKAVYGLLRS